MAYRDDNEALQAKVEGLQEELSAAKATIDELQGVADFARPELLPKRSHGFKSRACTINGPVDGEVFERIATVLQRASDAMETSLVNGTFAAKSTGLEITVLPGEDDELLMVFDERSPTNHGRGIVAFVFFSFAAIGAAEDGLPVWAFFMLLCGVLTTSLALYSAKEKSKEVQAERNELFATIGGLLQRSATKVRVAEQDVPAEVPLDDEVPTVAPELGR